MTFLSRQDPKWLVLLLAVAMTAGNCPAQDSDEKWFDRQAVWKEFDQFHFQVAGRAAYLVAPKQPAAGRPWVWRARFPGYHAEMDVALLGKGFHIGYVDVAGLFGSPQAVKIGDAIVQAELILTPSHTIDTDGCFLLELIKARS